MTTVGGCYKTKLINMHVQTFRILATMFSVIIVSTHICTYMKPLNGPYAKVEAV